MHPPSCRRWLVALVLAALVAAGCDLDEAELLRPGAGTITAEVGQLRVLGYDVDPAVDQWVDVLATDPAVVTEVETFRETDAALLAEGDTPGDRRRLFEAAGPGRTLLVELNCGPSPCDGSGPAPEIHVWEFVVDASAFSDGTDVATATEVTSRGVGEFVVIASDGPGPYDVEVLDGDRPPVTLVASFAPDGDIGTHIDVFAAVAPGVAQIFDRGDDRNAVYDVEVTSR